MYGKWDMDKVSLNIQFRMPKGKDYGSSVMRAGDEYDHSARFETKTKSYENTDSNYPLTFLLDGKLKLHHQERPIGAMVQMLGMSFLMVLPKPRK
jgi:hypothetical protein